MDRNKREDIVKMSYITIYTFNAGRVNTVKDKLLKKLKYRNVGFTQKVLTSSYMEFCSVVAELSSLKLSRPLTEKARDQGLYISMYQVATWPITVKNCA